MHKLRYLPCSLLVLLFLSANTFAWGDHGHRLVARIAARFLNPQSRTIVANLLKADTQSNREYYTKKCPDVLSLANKANLTPDETSKFLDIGLACIAPWPDPPLKWDRPYTSNWHFIDIPVNMRSTPGPTTTTMDLARDCRMDDERGDCAVLAIRRLRPVLGNPTEHVVARAEALKFIVHIIGDLHQPLHCVTDKKDFTNLQDLGDIGGNRKIVQFNVEQWDNNAHCDINGRWGEQWNLHSVWDEGIIDAHMKSKVLNEESYLAALIEPFLALNSTELAELQSGNLLTWINESYSIAVEKAYKLPDFDPDYEYTDKKKNKRKGGYRLPSAYYAANNGVVNEQLQNGGLRLARFLNETFVK